MAAATALALVLAAAPAAAQDVPWGTPSKKKKPVAKKPRAKKPRARKPVARKPVAKKAPTKKKPAAKPVAKRPQRPKAVPGSQDAKARTPAKRPPLTEPAVKAEPTAAPPAAVQKLTQQQLLDHFHKTLAPHGTWHKDQTFGEVWVPSEAAVGKNFAPYRSNGRWGLTKDGSWAWASKYKWGAIPFHYGRWVRTQNKRHAWIPGTNYAPAWVVWRTATGARQFVGWAPMAPMHHWMNSSAEKSWNFVPTRNLFGPKVENFVIRDKEMASTMFSQSRILSTHSDLNGVRKGVLNPASPTLKQGNVPFYAAPRTKLSLSDSAIAPITAESINRLNAPQPVAAVAGPGAKVAVSEPATPEVLVEGAAPSESGFATPPDENARRKKVRKRSRRRVRRSHQRRFARRRGVARRARVRRAKRAGVKHVLPVYRCGWTTGPHRKWRCGPTHTTPRGRR